MIIKVKAYYESVNRQLECSDRDVDYHIAQANIWKNCYLATKDKRGYGLLNRFAERMNKRHVRKGTKIAMETLDKSIEEMVYLVKYISDNEELA